MQYTTFLACDSIGGRWVNLMESYEIFPRVVTSAHIVLTDTIALAMIACYIAFLFNLWLFNLFDKKSQSTVYFKYKGILFLSLF